MLIIRCGRAFGSVIVMKLYESLRQSWHALQKMVDAGLYKGKYTGIMLMPVLFSCAAQPAPDTGEGSRQAWVVCQKSRPASCSDDNEPVCGSRDTGARCVRAPCPQARKNITYVNACAACKDSKVYSFRAGACES